MKVIVDGIATEYTDEGHGPVVLLLHGWGNTLHVFDAIVPALGKSRRIVRLDLPGFGATVAAPDPWNIEDYAHFIAAFIEKLKLDVDVVVGYSLGGRIAIKGLAHGFFSCHRAVLIAAAGVAERKTARNKFFAAVAKVGNVLLFPAPLSWRLQARKLLYSYTGSDYLTIASMSETFKNVVEEDLSANAAGVSIPTLLIWGDHDIVTPLSEGKKLNSLIRNSHIKIIQGSTHFLLQEKPADIVTLMTEFI